MLAKIIVNGNAIPVEDGRQTAGYLLGRLGFDWRNTVLSRWVESKRHFVDIDTNEFFVVASDDRYVTRPE